MGGTLPFHVSHADPDFIEDARRIGIYRVPVQPRILGTGHSDLSEPSNGTGKGGDFA